MDDILSPRMIEAAGNALSAMLNHGVLVGAEGKLVELWELP